MGVGDTVTAAVDVVITGEPSAVCSAAKAALRRGNSALAVLPSTGGGAALRRCLGPLARRCAIMTGAEVVCVDGIRGVEVVIIRRLHTGRLIAVNATAFVAT